MAREGSKGRLRGLEPGHAVNKLAYLSAMEVFQDLTPAEVEEVDRMATMRPYPRGRVIYVPGQTGEVLFLLKRGRVDLYQLSPQGRKLVLASLGPATFFGEMSLLGQRMYEAFAEAAEDSLLCVLSRADVERLLLAKPRVALRILETLGQRLRETEARLQELAFKDTTARVASLLLRLSRHGGQEVVGWSHQELADNLGVYRETVTNALNQLKALGLIDIGRRRIVLRDVPGLQRRAGLD